MKQFEGESIDNFIKRFENKSRILMPLVTETTLLVYFKNGVLSDLKKDLIVNGPDSLRKTFDRVRLLSLADETTSQKNPQKRET